ncbi:MAG: hypothetical protein HW406_129 [Candidatus Brocadiaceae bacterium]|nr:hypothetical protein [Candidatus Brocadiaceae bacterium]
MIVERDMKQCEYVCLHCKGNNFVLIGTQRQNGLFKDRELWNCKNCHSTFAKETVKVKKTAEDETFNKRAISYYGRIKFSTKGTS